MSIRTYAVNCNDAWLNTEGDDISGSYVKYRDHQEVVDALEAKCAALAAELKQSQIDAGCYKKGMEASNERLVQVAAENAGLKDEISNITFMRDDDFFGSTQRAQEVMGRLVNVKTPATDAYRDELRAQGIEMAAKSDQFSMWVQQGLRSFAIGVRQGGAE